MKVVHVLPYFAPAWGFGGVVRAAFGLTSALAALGHEITVITTDAGDSGARIAAHHGVLNGIAVTRCRNLVPLLRRINLSSPAGMRAVLQEALRETDVLHVHEFRTVENLLALGVARELGVPVVMSPHGTVPYGAGRSTVKRVWDRLVGRWSAVRIDHVAALTLDEASDVRQLWAGLGLDLKAECISVVPNGVALKDFEDMPQRTQFRSRWEIPADVPLILFLGRLHERKGAHYLVDALQHLPDTWLALVGPDEGQAAQLRSRAAQAGVAGRVVFTGLLTGEDKRAAFVDASLLALPAVGEGLPMVALEAMAAGLPIALSDGCHLPEAVEAGAGVRLATLEGEAIAAQLAAVLAEPQRAREMGLAGRQLVEQQYTWRAVASTMISIYSTVAKKSREQDAVR